MSSQPSLWDTSEYISSPGSEPGTTPSTLPDGPGRCGPPVCPAPDSRAQAKGKGLMTLVTYGRYLRPSSASADLERSLASKLMTRLDSAGSTLFAETWKRRATPLRRRYWEHTARVRPTSVNGCTSLPTPNVGDLNASRSSDAVAYSLRWMQREKHNSQLAHTVQSAALASVAIPNGDDANNGTRASGEFRSLTRDAQLAALPTPNAMEGGQTSRSGKRKGELLMGGIAQLATVSSPSARDWKDTGMSESGVDPDGSIRSRLDQLLRQAQLAASGQTATGGTAGTKSIGQLDPAYSRWLMGLPPAWCDCAVMAMRSMRKPPRRLSPPRRKLSSA